MENKAKKFDPNLPTEVELTFDEPKTGENQYGTWYLYGIKQLITGENGFFATDLLHNRLQELGAKTGDKLLITKVAKNDKTFFDVKKLGGGEDIKEAPIEDIAKANTGELSVEEKINTLWKEYEKKNPKTNVTVDDLPF